MSNQTCRGINVFIAGVLFSAELSDLLSGQRPDMASCVALMSRALMRVWGVLKWQIIGKVFWAKNIAPQYINYSLFLGQGIARCLELQMQPLGSNYNLTPLTDVGVGL